MANITRFDPFSELTRFNPFGEDFFRGFAVRPMFHGLEGEPQIRLDVAEDDKAYTVKAEIPGVKKSDIKVSIDGNQVSISAEVKKVVRSERYYGSVSRSFSLAQDVDQATAEAKYNDGVLELTLPKMPGGSARQLTVS